MERRRQFKAKPNDLTLAHMDKRGEDFDVSLPSPSANKLLKGFIIRRTAVGITGAILLDGANQHLFRTQHLGPADRGRKKMGVAEGDVGDWNRFADWLSFRGFRY